MGLIFDFGYARIGVIIINIKRKNMAQAKKKTATRTKKAGAKRATGSRANTKMQKKQQQAGASNMFFVISMTVLAATLLFANLLMIAA